MPKLTDQRMLTPQELADFLGVPLATVYAWRYKGHGPVARTVGRHLRYLESDVDAWLDVQADKPKASA